MSAFAFARPVARWLVRLEIILLTAIYFYFVISDGVPLAAFMLLALIWLARAWTTGKFTIPTAFDLPIAILLVWSLVSLSVSSNWSLSLPKVYGLVMSVAFFYAIVNQIATRRDLADAAFWLALVCTGIALAGLIGTDWAQNKIVSASFIYDRLPRFIQAVPRSIAGGFARNGVGGTLTLTIPLLAAIAVQNSREAFSVQYSVFRRLKTEHWIKPIALAAFAVSLVTLALTQSRGGIFGAAVGVFAIAVWRERRFAWLAVASAIGLIVAVALGYGDALVNVFLAMDAGAGTLASRLEVWQRGVMMVQDFPYTGIGIGTYNQLAHALYPFFIATPDEIVPHAHNNFLQVAVDVGIPGFIAYVGLMTAFVLAARRAYHASADVGARALIAGALGGMLAHQVFGLTDAFMLGTKPGIVMWILLALVAVIDARREEWRGAGDA